MADATDNVATQKKPNFIERKGASFGRWARRHRISATALAMLVISTALWQPGLHPYYSLVYLAIYLAIVLRLYLQKIPIPVIPVIAAAFTDCALFAIFVGFWFYSGMHLSRAALGQAHEDAGINAAVTANHAACMGNALLVQTWAKESVVYPQGSGVDEKRVGDVEEGGAHGDVVDEKKGLHEEEEEVKS